MARTALIVGAGIGGLSAGIALRRAGWEIRIFERATSPRELGFGVALAPNAVAALRDLGVVDAVLARSFAPSRGRFEVRRMDGHVLKAADVVLAEALGGQMAIALRSALHGALLDAVGLDTIALGWRADGFTQTDDGVVLRSADGDTVEGDVLIGADGVTSAIRRVLHPDEPPPRASGLVSVRAAVEGATSHLGGLSAIYYLGPGVESVIVRASATGIYWFISVNERLLPPGMRDPAAIVRVVSPWFDDTFRAIAGATEEMRTDELVDRDALPFWGTGRVTLLGDAAHPLLPHTGQGAAQAMVDAVSLGRHLAGGADVKTALRTYEDERRPKTTVLLGQGRRTARVMRTMNPLANAVRNVVVRMIPVAPLVKVMATVNRRAGTDVRAQESREECR